MKILLKPCLLLGFLIATNFYVTAQSGFKIKNYMMGYRLFEIDAIGNNPTTIAPFLKHPEPYMHYLNSLRYNSLYGDPGPQTIPTVYFNIELNKPDAAANFWKKHVIQTGIFITKKMSKGAGAVENEYSKYTVNYSDRYSDKYVLTQNLQFAGANLGLARKFKVTKRLQTSIGLQWQGGFALVHNYQPYWDSSYRFSPGPWQTKSITYLPRLKGKNFFQWQLMLPLGVEYNIDKSMWIRLEVEPGIVGSRYRYKYLAAREAHGAGLWLIYQP